MRCKVSTAPVEDASPARRPSPTLREVLIQVKPQMILQFQIPELLSGDQRTKYSRFWTSSKGSEEIGP
jgi:hypothetical protein